MTNKITYHAPRSLNEINAVPVEYGTPKAGAKKAAAAAARINPNKIMTPLKETHRVKKRINRAKIIACYFAKKQPNWTAASIEKEVNAAEEAIKKSAGILITPANYLKVAFKKIKSHPLSSSTLPTTISLTVNNFLRASINCGYEPTKNPTWSQNERTDLIAYQNANHTRTMSILDFCPNAPTKTKDIFEKLETTDKGGISFQIGTLATYLTAEAWLSTSGDTLDMLLHERLYSKGLKQPIPNNEKHADFVAITTNKKIHLFESKGGIKKDSHKNVVNGLAQLEATAKHIPPVGYLCVHASITGGSEIEIVAYDPPGDDMPSAESLDSIFDMGYLRIAQAMHAIDAFNVLKETGKSTQNNTPWVFTTYQANGEIRIAAPDFLLDHSEELRAFLEFDELTKGISAEDKASPQKTNAIINGIIKKLENTISNKIIDWHLTARRYRFKTIKELEDKLKTNALEIIQDMDSMHNSHYSASPFPQPTEDDFILTTKGLISANKEFTAHFKQDGI